MPRVRRISQTTSRRASARCQPSIGSSSGPVPSRAPSAAPTRRSTANVRSDSAVSFRPAWISAAVQPGNAALAADAR